MKAIRKQITGRTIVNSQSRAVLYLLPPPSNPQPPLRPHRPAPAARPQQWRREPPIASRSQQGSKNKFPHSLENPSYPPNKCHPARSCRRRSGRQPSRRILISHPKAGEKTGLLRLRGCSLREPPTPLRKTGRQTAITANTIRKQRSRSANSGASNPARATRSS